MKPFTTLTPHFFWMSLILGSCSKKNDTPVMPPPSDSTGTTVGINFTFSAVSTNYKTFELIISELGGKILLDSLAPINTLIKTRLSTNATLFDLTTVYYNPFDSVYYHDSSYMVHTYKNVNPSNWATGSLVPAPLNLSSPGGGAAATAYYYNVPPLPFNITDVLRFSNIYSTFSAGYDGLKNEITANYSRIPGTYNYLYLPPLGLYHLSIPQSNHDSVNLSKMDTIARQPLSFPTGWTVSSAGSVFYGMLDSSDLSKTISMPQYSIATNPLLEYPPVSFEKYLLSVTAFSVTGDGASYYYYGNTVPTALPLPNGSSYTLSSTLQDNFSVSFAGVTPTYYTSEWTSGNVFYSIASSPDSTVQHPLSMLVSLKSKMLQGRTPTSLSLNDFYYINLDDLSYSDYFANPGKISQKNISKALTISKFFN